MKHTTLSIAIVLYTLALPASAAEKITPKPAPTHANIAYGTHERQVLDFYQATSDTPTPLVYFVHGGGWVRGDKSAVANVDTYLAAGISVASINYRYTWQAQSAGVDPPVSWPLADAARALQFIRSHAKDWNIDPTRIGGSGTSAGACTTLYLALHDDLAQPESTDPIARESTRLTCAAVAGAQTSLDPQQLKTWTPNSRYGGHAFGITDPIDLTKRDTKFPEFLAARESILPWIKAYSPYEFVSKDDPPLYLKYNAPPAMGQPQKDPTHTANFGQALAEHCSEVGVPCELAYPNAPNITHPNETTFLIDQLKK